MSGVPATGRSRSGLRWRLALSLAGLTAVTFAVAASVLSTVLERRFEAELQSELGRRQSELDELLGSTGAELSRTLERIVRRLAHQDSGLVRALVASGPEAVPVGARLLGLTGLDLLTVLDAEGVAVSAGHWPERAGLDEPQLQSLPPEPAIVRVGWPRGERLALLVTRSIRLGPHRLSLVAGRALDSLLERNWLGDDAWLFDFAETATSPSSPGEGTAATLGRSAVGEPIASGDGALYGRRVLLDPAGQPVGSIVVAVDRSGLTTLRGELRRALILFGLFLTMSGAAAGAWIAGRMARPVRQLVRAVDAISAGAADYTFPRAARDEFEELEQAFSRMQRSLHAQQRRSAAAERIAAWREVARHVAHEVKNPLAPIRLTVENLVRARRDDSPLFDELFHEGASTILEEVEQLRELVEEFSAFARLPAPRPRRADLHLLLDGVTELYAAEPGLEIRREYDRELPPLTVDPDQISRALKNVVGNAVEAMRDLEPAATRRLELRTFGETERVVIEVWDSGPGLPPEAQEKIFQPYFTTKRHGTGLGMAIAYRVVTEHGGQLAAENRPGRGAVVSIRLPRRSPLTAGGEATTEDPDGISPRGS